MRSETFKLLDRNGDVIGVIWVPMHWAQQLGNGGGQVKAVWTSNPHHPSYPPDEEFLIKSGVIATQFTITTAVGRRGVVLDGIPLEEFEKLADCAFAPGFAETKRGQF